MTRQSILAHLPKYRSSGNPFALPEIIRKRYFKKEFFFKTEECRLTEIV
jgi:hypothetical protein